MACDIEVLVARVSSLVLHLCRAGLARSVWCSSLRRCRISHAWLFVEQVKEVRLGQLSRSWQPLLRESSKLVLPLLLDVLLSEHISDRQVDMGSFADHLRNLLGDNPTQGGQLGQSRTYFLKVCLIFLNWSEVRGSGSLALVSCLAARAESSRATGPRVSSVVCCRGAGVS